MFLGMNIFPTKDISGRKGLFLPFEQAELVGIASHLCIVYTGLVQRVDAHLSAGMDDPMVGQDNAHVLDVAL